MLFGSFSLTDNTPSHFKWQNIAVFIGSGGVYDAAHEKRMAEIRQQLRAQGVSIVCQIKSLYTVHIT